MVDTKPRAKKLSLGSIYCRRVIYKYSTEKGLLLIMKMQERVFAPFAYCEQQYFLLNRG